MRGVLGVELSLKRVVAVSFVNKVNCNVVVFALNWRLLKERNEKHAAVEQCQQLNYSGMLKHFILHRLGLEVAY